MQDASIPPEQYPSDGTRAGGLSADSPRYLGNEGLPVHIAGAGAMGMAVLLISLTMLFGGSMAALIVIRAKSVQWPPAGMPALPMSLWISTLVILVSSVTIQLALSAVKNDDEKGLVRFLGVTLGLGGLFLGLQIANWLEFYHAIPNNVAITGAYLVMFYFLTALHAAHVIGGLIPLIMTFRNAKAGKYSRYFYPGVRYTTAYWHFLDVIWVVLFVIIYF